MKRNIIILVIITIGGFASYYDYIKNKEFTENEVPTFATITDVQDITSDNNAVPRGAKKAITSYMRFHTNTKLMNNSLKVGAL